MKIKLVVVEWVDARTDPGWFDADAPHTNPPIKTYGLLVAQDDRKVVLASTFDPETGRWSDRMEIPAAMTTSIKTIRAVDA